MQSGKQKNISKNHPIEGVVRKLLPERMGHARQFYAANEVREILLQTLAERKPISPELIMMIIGALEDAQSQLDWFEERLL